MQGQHGQHSNARTAQTNSTVLQPCACSELAPLLELIRCALRLPICACAETAAGTAGTAETDRETNEHARTATLARALVASRPQQSLQSSRSLQSLPWWRRCARGRARDLLRMALALLGTKREVCGWRPHVGSLMSMCCCCCS